jgi:hypothetical protein
LGPGRGGTGYGDYVMASNRLIEDVGRLLRLARDQVEELPNFNKAKAPLTSSLSDSGFSINNDGCSAAPARS